MYLKSAIFIALSFIIVITSSKLVHAEPTKWENARTSLTILLDSGWQLIGHSATRVKTSNTPVSQGFEQETFNFILTNRGKYIICITDDPRPPIANFSRCRNLN